MSDSFDPYKILGISPGASLEEIRRAYRRQATKYHPDAGGDAWVFQQIQSAYSQLSSGSSTGTASHHAHQAEEIKPASEHPRKRPDYRAGSADWTSTTSTSADDFSAKSADSQEQQSALRDWLFGKPLKLHNETSYFILANFMDLVMTGILLRNDAMEVNPIADLIFQFWGFGGLMAFKISIVIFVCVITQWIARKSMIKAKVLLVGGTLLVAAVVVYSMWLARFQLGVG